MLTALNRFSQLERYFDQVMDDVMGRPIGGSLVASSFEPQSDVRANEAEVVLTFDVPGVKQSELEIKLENRVLTLKGERKYAGNADEQAWLGRRYGSFSTSLSLPDSVDAERVTAHLSDGVLTVRLPKHERARARKIAISTNSADSDTKQLGQ